MGGTGGIDAGLQGGNGTRGVLQVDDRIPGGLLDEREVGGGGVGTRGGGGEKVDRLQGVSHGDLGNFRPMVSAGSVDGGAGRALPKSKRLEGRGIVDRSSGIGKRSRGAIAPGVGPGTAEGLGDQGNEILGGSRGGLDRKGHLIVFGSIDCLVGEEESVGGVQVIDPLIIVLHADARVQTPGESRSIGCFLHINPVVQRARLIRG